MTGCVTMTGMDWRKSTYSFANGNCVEVARGVQVRDSRDPDGPVLAFSGTTWGRFTDALKRDAPAPG